MSHTLKDAATSTLDTVSHLVDEAHGRLDHLPMLHRSTPWWRSKWAIAGAVLVVLSAVWMLRRRRADRRVADRNADFAHTRAAADRAADAAAARVDLTRAG